MEVNDLKNKNLCKRDLGFRTKTFYTLSGSGVSKAIHGQVSIDTLHGYLINILTLNPDQYSVNTYSTLDQHFKVHRLTTTLSQQLVNSQPYVDRLRYVCIHQK